MFTAVLIVVVSAMITAAQEESTYYNNSSIPPGYENITVSVPKLPQITPAIRPEATVTADFNGSAVTLRYVCLYFTAPDKCPELIVRILAGNQIIKEFGYKVNTTSDCRDNVCLYYVTARLPENFTAVKLVYTLRYPDNTSKTYTLVLTSKTVKGPLLNLVSIGITLGVAFGLMLHESPFAVAMGAFAVPLVLYLLSKIGLISLDFFVINASIILALVLFFITKGVRR